MHELSLLADLLKKIDTIATKQQAEKVVGVSVKLGALSHISAGHFRAHFIQGVQGTKAEGAYLAVETSNDLEDPHAQEILLQSVEVEVGDDGT